MVKSDSASDKMDFFDQRMTRMEDCQAKQTQDLAEVVGTLHAVRDNVDTIRLTLDKFTANSQQSGLLQKGLLAAIVVQSLLHGLTTPELAKQMVTHIFGGQ